MNARASVHGATWITLRQNDHGEFKTTDVTVTTDTGDFVFTIYNHGTMLQVQTLPEVVHDSRAAEVSP